MINDTKNLFKGAVRNSLKDINRESFDNIRIGTVVSSINNSKYLTVRINKTGEIINNVLIPKGGFEVETGDVVTILCPDIRNRTQNFIINAYGSKTKYSSNDYLESPTINTPIIQNPTITGGVWTYWTPTWSNLVVGNATVTAYYKQIGKTVFFRVSLVFGNTTSITGNPLIVSLPVSPATYPVATPLGLVRILDSDLSVTYTAQVNSAGIIALWDVKTSSYLRTAAITSTIPFTWTTNDQIGVQGVYESA